MAEDVAFKGVNGGLELAWNDKVAFAAILAGLTAKLAASSEFFPAGTVVKLPAACRLSVDEKAQLVALLGRNGLVCQEAPAACGVVGAAGSTGSGERENYEIQALVVNKTLRSGQKVTYDGAVVVIGDVNAGAQVIAGGDIIILGACRGLAHAGARGDESATITASRIVATQLRIAGLIARAPDDLDKPACVETARIMNEKVVIEPANR